MKKTYKNNRLGWTAVEMTDNTFYEIRSPEKHFCLVAELIIGSPDWVEEKEWVITAFKGLTKYVGSFITIKEDGRYSYEENKLLMGATLDDMLHKNYCVDSGDFSIFSVLCNGIEWKVGDAVQVNTSKGEIKRFFLVDNDQKVMVDIGHCSVFIELLTPAKVILTTEDGCSVGDPEQILFYVSQSMVINKQRAKDFRLTHTGKYFSTREAAEAFISQNKKKYSEKQIKDVWHKMYPTSSANSLIDSLNNLITKLNEK